METLFSADLHIHHKFMADLRGIGREHLNEHDEMLVENWNGITGVKDEVWFLGDFSFGGQELNRKFFAALHGRKHLVRGNHDPKHVQDLPWIDVHDLVSRKFNGVRYVMCHYPMLTWANAHHGSRHLHGHSHGNLDPAAASTRMDVGVDTHPQLRPYSLEEVEDYFANRTYDFVDHHGGDE